MRLPIEAAYSLIMLICPLQPTQPLWSRSASTCSCSSAGFTGCFGVCGRETLSDRGSEIMYLCHRVRLQTHDTWQGPPSLRRSSATLSRVSRSFNHTACLNNSNQFGLFLKIHVFFFQFRTERFHPSFILPVKRGLRVSGRRMLSLYRL